MGAPSPPLVEVDGLWKRYRRHHDRPASVKDALLSRIRGEVHEVEKKWAVRDLSLHVKPGEAVGLIGPNGCGKTTVLSVISNVLRPTRGSVQVRGRVCPMLQAVAGFHRDLTGLENVYLSGAILGMMRKDIDAKLGDIIGFVRGYAGADLLERDADAVGLLGRGAHAAGDTGGGRDTVGRR